MKKSLVFGIDNKILIINLILQIWTFRINFSLYFSEIRRLSFYKYTCIIGTIYINWNINWSSALQNPARSKGIEEGEKRQAEQI